MPIRILHVVESLGIGGGVETGIANLIERMDRERFEHILCAVFRMGPSFERFRVAEVVGLEQPRKRFRVQVGALAGVIRTIRPVIVHSRNWGALEAVIAARWSRDCRAIHSEHGVEVDVAREPWRRKWFRRVAYGLADRVFAVSYQLKNTLARSTGVAAHKIGVIHNGVDSARFRPDPRVRERYRAELELGGQEFVIGCLGRLDRIKDYPTILRAAELFGQSCPAWRLLILGGGAERRALEQFVAARTALPGRVRFLGPSDRVPEFLNAIDVYALPSIREGISNSLLEAMSAGLPVVATDTGGNPEVVEDGKSGLLFPVANWERLAELLLLLYREPHERRRLGEQALARVAREFSLDSMIRKYEQMYREVKGERAANREHLVSAGELSNVRD
jgi:sugar transferase (PEP-CTERM/EpsH1 system associated)